MGDLSPEAPPVVVAIHQPNYLPWMGYLDKVLRSDVFVFLDHVEMSRGSYTQRVKILGQGEPAWLTVPIRKSGRSTQAIAETECDARSGWAQKHLRTLQQQYGKHTGFREVFPAVEAVLADPGERLAEVNARLVRALAAGLGASCRFVESSTLDLGDAAKSELLARVVRAVGGTHYLHGGGGEAYQEPEVFAAHGVVPVAQRFQHPAYAQRGTAEFLPGLSVVDALFNRGFDGTRELLARPAGGA